MLLCRSFDVVWATDHVGDESDAGVIAFERTVDAASYALSAALFTSASASAVSMV